jgi:hypothetical protein
MQKKEGVVRMILPFLLDILLATESVTNVLCPHACCYPFFLLLKWYMFFILRHAFYEIQ